MPKKKELGRALVRQNKRNGRNSFTYDTLEESSDWCRLPAKSITQETTLDDFLHTANLSNKDFAAQKPNVRVLSKAEIVGMITLEERKRRQLLMEQNKGALIVLKRLEQLDGVVITPYERNLEFWRQLWQVVERSDVLVQVVDARQPLLFFSPSLNDYVKETDPYKETLVLINKSDFLTCDQREVWARYFGSIGVRVLFFSAINSEGQHYVQNIKGGLNQSGIAEETQEGLENEELQGSLSIAELCNDFDESGFTSSETSTVQGESEEDERGASSESYNSAIDVAEEEKNEVVNICDILSVHGLIAELTQIGTKHRGRPYVTVGFLGYPNVGKSSTLNALCGVKKTPVSATPGKTKHFQTMFLQPDLQLCDCPGMVMPSFAYTHEDLVVAGILSIDEMRDCIPPIRIICEQIPREVLTALYGISIPPPKEFEDPNRPPTPHELLAAYACIVYRLKCYPTVLLKPNPHHIYFHDKRRSECVSIRAYIEIKFQKNGILKSTCFISPGIRGFMSAKGNPHYDRAARIILKDYVKGRLRYCHPPPGIDATDYQLMGATERLGEENKKIMSELMESEKAKSFLRLSAYLAPTELHKLWFRLQSLRDHRRDSERKKGTVIGEEEAVILTDFDKTVLTSQVASLFVPAAKLTVGGHPLIRSKKKLASMPRALGGDNDVDVASVASWSTVSNTTAGGASLFSGVTNSSAVGKKPWRQLSAVKKISQVEMRKVGPVGVGRNRKKKEKLRRIYADLDQHEVG
ncbi:unnamed protein product [Hydatigera taeniaeformis]|uniref:Large subunit GTPase 1 homolog n=1 Tax=Hydatigena taeniaeformis TaxID=6205 RepID=A0A158RDR7_HYDTA|nr:unnamed protein product [Hydatigera taeniaeformis]